METQTLNVDGLRLKERDSELAERKRLIRARMSPAGTLGLDKGLEAARQQYGIPDTAFSMQAAFNTVLVLQVSMQESETFKDSMLFMPEVTKERELRKAPIGVIVSAGLGALDALCSHGIDLGHKVVFVHSAPYFIRFDTIGGVDQHLIVLQASQIRASYNVAEDLKARRVFIKQNTDAEGVVTHVLVDENRQVTVPQKPEVE